MEYQAIENTEQLRRYALHQKVLLKPCGLRSNKNIKRLSDLDADKKALGLKLGFLTKKLLND